ncbi:hypothetical protein EON65_57650, partial [archaeon]
MKRGGFGKKEPRAMISATKMLCCLAFILIASAMMMWDLYRSSFAVSTVIQRHEARLEELRKPLPTSSSIDTSPVTELKTPTPIAITPIIQTQAGLFEVKSAEEYEQQAANTLKSTLQSHPLHTLSPTQRSNLSISDYFHFVSQSPSCKDLPVFTSMANVYSELYWQLIENFIYTMVKFQLVQCTLMI